MMQFFATFWKDILGIGGPIGVVLGAFGAYLGYPTDCSTSLEGGVHTTCDSPLWGEIVEFGKITPDQVTPTLAGIGLGAAVGLLIGIVIVAVRPDKKKDVLPDVDI